MARRSNKFTLLGDVKIEVVARKGKEIIIKEMTFQEAKNLRKAKGWKYDNFQIGFHTYKPTKY